MSGFWAKILLFWAIFEAGFWTLVLFGGTLAMVGLFYYLKIARAIYIEEPDADTAPSISLGRSSTIAIAICVIGVVGMGLYPRPFVDAALSAAAALLGG